MDYDDLIAPTVTLTAREVLGIGLKLVNYTDGRINRVKNKNSNMSRFASHFGCSPFVANQIFEDLQITNTPEARLDEKKISIEHFLQALHFLCICEVESRREPMFDRSPKTMREWVWHYVKKIQALKTEKIVFPDAEFFGSDVWILSVDCADCPIEEIIHPTLSQDPELFSFKVNGAGLRCEFGIDLFRSKVIWMSGPHLPGKVNDNTIFAEKGLKEKLASIGKKGLGDKIYNGHPDECSTFNATDSKLVSTFKAQVQMHHEQFNGVVKDFRCTSQIFCHKPNKVEKHAMCFEVVVVICQCRLDHGEPLFDLMAGLF